MNPIRLLDTLAKLKLIKGRTIGRGSRFYLEFHFEGNTNTEYEIPAQWYQHLNKNEMP